MSTFSGLTGALSSIIAQRQALEVAGQNVANANTVGYTRQRVDLTSVQSLSAPTMFSNAQAAGNGVKVTGITRMGDVFLDARLRSQTATASAAGARAETLARLESTVDEPSDTGLTATLSRYWAAWQDVGNKADDGAARKVLLGEAAALVEQIESGHRAVSTQWNQLRTEVDTLTTEVNTTAAAVAHLNEQIRGVQVSGGSVNELVDQRNVLVTRLSELVGATGRQREDGTLDVMVGGNALVRGVTANEVEAVGPWTMPTDAGSTESVRLVWSNTGQPGDPSTRTAVAMDGGRIAAHVADLAPGGLLRSAAQSWNDVATRLATEVNAVHTTGHGADGFTGRDFFTIDTSQPAALGLRVALTDPAHVAAAADGAGAYDGSIADTIARIGQSTTGPDRVWRDFVVDLGVRTQSATQRATVAEDARATAENLQLANASVDLDEETVNMLAYQRAYEGAARVLTAIDEMLDVLINRTGVVGR